MTILDTALAHLAADRCRDADAALQAGLREDPLDPSLHLVRGVVARTLGSPVQALRHFWAALALEPQATGTRQALCDLVCETAGTAAPDKDFSLNSGERQTAATLGGIRADHRARYALAARWLRQYPVSPARMIGLDCFCGNGYGSRMLADQIGLRMIGLDGSAEAVALAERAYGSHRVVFGQAVFPFRLAPGLFHVAVCFESVEHVANPAALLATLASAVQGPLLLSVPLEEGLPFGVNADRFAHHHRHFTRAEITALLAQAGWPVIAGTWGQKVYRLQDRRVCGLLPAADMAVTPPQEDSQFLILATMPAA